MSVIHKIDLSSIEVQEVELPANATILSVQNQMGYIVMWYMFDKIPNQPMRDRTVFMSCTGQEFVCNGFEYIGTVQLRMGDIVLHVFID